MIGPGDISGASENEKRAHAVEREENGGTQGSAAALPVIAVSERRGVGVFAS